MTEDFDFTSIAVVVGAFGLGYWLVSAVINKIKGVRDEPGGPVLREDVPLRGEREPIPRSTGAWRAASIYHEEPAEQQHALVLGLHGSPSPEEVKRAYHALLLQYHPDRVEHLGPELKEVAQRKTREIVAAYEYFRRRGGW